MINKWDIISSVNADGTQPTAYSVVMDGSRYDALWVARQLQDYVRPKAEPAVMPFIYRFDLDNITDKETLQKIRAIISDIVEQIKQNAGASAEEYTPDALNSITPATVRTIELSNLEHSIHQIADTYLMRHRPENPPVSIEPENAEEAHRKKYVSTQTLNRLFGTDDDSQETQNGSEISVFQTRQSQPSARPDLPTETVSKNIPPSKAQTGEPKKSPSDISSKKSLLQQASAKAGKAQQPLEDIFLAETKYDIFVDIGNDTPQNKTAATLSKPSKQEGKITKDTPANPFPSVQTDFSDKPEFNVFDHKLNDQTALLDVEDVADITKHITQKDLEFIRHAQNTPQTTTVKQADTSAKLAQTDTESQETIMDPFERLLSDPSGTQTKDPAPTRVNAVKKTANKPKSRADTVAKKTPQPPVPKPPSVKLSDLQNNTQADKKPEKISAIPVANREKNMNNQPGEKKNFIPLRRKEQPASAPATPRPPKPAAPRPPQQAAPRAPKPILPQVPRPAAPQEERQPTIVRRHRPEHTAFEKTTTIDHSIELPLSELKKHNWPLEVPLIPTYTLDNMVISVNRFAHATAISVIENPGKMYNPLVLHGTGGTGKTHFLHAIGYALSKKYGQENIFITNGVRLSRGIQRYVMEGNIAKFESFISSVKALFIDDIHLISINEQNRAYLSKLLNDFTAQHKQVVITSKYPPENLAKLEELLHFKLDSGWISDLKPANGPARMRIIQNMLTNNGINITNENINRFFGHPNMSLGTVGRSIRRVRVLEKLMFRNADPDKCSPLAIFDQLLASKGEDQTSLIAQKAINDVQSASVLGNGEWGRIGFFYPQNQSNMMNWLLFALQQRAKELGIPGGPDLAVRSSYSTENIISSAFKIANLCDNKKLKGAVILGPNLMSCEPSVRENFYDILTHMLEVMLIRCGVINFEEASAPSTYVKILAELLR